jgi:hypothetical protein
MDIKPRKYNAEFRKKIALKINKLKDKNDFINLFNIIESDIGNDMSVNKNGIFFNLNILSDGCIDKINNYLLKILDNNTETETKIKYQTYNQDDLDNGNKIGPKLSNQEKNILKKNKFI